MRDSIRTVNPDNVGAKVAECMAHISSVEELRPLYRARQAAAEEAASTVPRRSYAMLS